MMHPGDPTKEKLHARLRDLSLGAVVLVWVTLVFWAFTPGLMSPDSLSQYSQGLSGEYSNAHPPAMSWLLGLFGKTVGSPWPFLLIDLLALSVGMALLLRKARPRALLWSLLFLIGYLALPTTWSLGAVLWKDSAIGGVLLLTVAALHYGRLRIALELMVCSMLLRHNAIVAVAPLLVFAIWKAPALTSARVRWVALAGGLVLLNLAPKVADKVARAQDLCAVCVPAVFDLAAVYIDSPELFPNSVFANDVSVDELKVSFSPATVVFLLWGSEPVRHINPEFVFSHRKEILTEWVAVIPQRPWAYSKSRLALFAHLLGIKGDVFYAFHTGIDANAWGLTVAHGDGWVHQKLRALQEYSRNSLAFRGWFWLGTSAALCALLLWRRRGSLAMYTALSGFLFTVTLVGVTTSSDFRFLFWTVVSCFAAGALLLGPSLPHVAPVGPDEEAVAQAHAGPRQPTQP